MAEAVVTVQRDWGDRSDRAHARLKYTIEDHGLDAFRAEVEKRSGVKLEQPKPFTFDSTGDRYGWSESEDGNGHLTLFVQNGRIRDIPGGPQWMAGLREIAQMHQGDFRLTANQNIIVAGVAPDQRWDIDKLVEQLQAHARCFPATPQFHGLRRAAYLRPRAWRKASAICPIW